MKLQASGRGLRARGAAFFITGLQVEAFDLRLRNHRKRDAEVPSGEIGRVSGFEHLAGFRASGLGIWDYSNPGKIVF